MSSPSDSDESRRGETMLDDEECGSGSAVSTDNNDVEETTAGNFNFPQMPMPELKVSCCDSIATSVTTRRSDCIV